LAGPEGRGRARGRRRAGRRRRGGARRRPRKRRQQLQDPAHPPADDSRARQRSRLMSTTLEDYAAENPISRNRSGIIGRAVDRYEGPLKVTGTAPYAYEVETPSPPAYGVLLGASIGCGVVSAVDDAAARAAPGVKLVWHHFSKPANQPERGARSYVGSQAGAKPVFVEPTV